MDAHGLSRRTMLAVLAAAVPALVLPRAGRAGALPRAGRAGAVRRLYLSARGDTAGGFRATGIAAGEAIAFDIALPARGHSMALHPDGAHAVFFGRRPGDFALVVDIAKGRSVRMVDAAAGRWFNGHGVFTADGARLFATETAGGTGDGMIGIYDPADGYRRVGEWRSGGLDPHDIRLLSDGRTLAVANGGILRHEDAPRAILNLDTMAPSLAYLDARDGTPLVAAVLPPALHQLSIRHLAVAPGDRVAIAMQYKGPEGDAVPLVATHRPGAAAIRPIAPPAEAVRGMRQYCGSAAMDPSGRILGVTSPRGGLALFWDVRDNRYAGAHRMADCCGIAPGDAAGSFVLSSGYGVVTRYDALAGRAGDMGALIKGAKWDNHMLAVPARVG